MATDIPPFPKNQIWGHSFHAFQIQLVVKKCKFPISPYEIKPEQSETATYACGPCVRECLGLTSPDETPELETKAAS